MFFFFLTRGNATTSARALKGVIAGDLHISYTCSYGWTQLLKTARDSHTIQHSKMQTKDLVSTLKKFDAYPKTLEDFRVKTFGGAAG